MKIQESDHFGIEVGEDFFAEVENKRREWAWFLGGRDINKPGTYAVDTPQKCDTTVITSCQ